MERVGPVEHVRERPWAAIARVPTAEGDLYFKASAPSTAFEPSLTLALAHRHGVLVPDVLQINVERAWMITRDAGTQLRELITDPPDATIWHTLLPLYAELQIDLCDSADELCSLGTPDRRPEALVDAYDDLLSRWPQADPAPPTAEIEMLAKRLGDRIPASLAHEEVGDNNIFLRDERPVVIDWAEAVVAHPFSGLVNTFRGLVDRWGFEPGASDLLRLRDAYLEPWTRFAALPDLVELFGSAYTLGMVCRALSWDQIVSALTGAARAEYERFVLVWLEILSETLETEATLGA